MLGTQLVTELGRRVEDETNENFSVNHKLQALNNAQNTVVTLLHNYHLSELKTKAENKTVTSGKATFTDIFTPYSITGVTATSPTDGSASVFTKTSHTLANGDTVELSGFTEMTDVNGLTGIVEGVAGNNFSVKGVLGGPAETTGGTVTKLYDGNGLSLRNGIIKVYDRTNSRFANIVSHDSFTTGDDYAYGTICCVGEKNLTISPTSCVAVDVYYIKTPTDIANSAVECEFNKTIEQIILDLAEAEIFNADNRTNRANVAYQRGVNMIQSLNDRIIGEGIE